MAGGSGLLNRRITSPHAQKTGLALDGFREYLHACRVLVFGESEVWCLESLSSAACSRPASRLKCPPRAGGPIKRSAMRAM
ncbi:MAG: hypothetical protein ACREUQ_12200 [Burkholderiales bacterium]